MPNFSFRSHQLEIMDDLQCHGQEVNQTLLEIEFINKWLGGSSVTLDGVRCLVKGQKKREIIIADLGCGGGGMLRQLAGWGRKNNLSLKLIGIDANPNILDFARQQCIDFPEISFENIDILSPEFENKKYDIVIGTLFYHHFSSDNLKTIISNLIKQADIGLVINDIHRHPIAYYSIKLLTYFFSKSAMVKYDAPLSVLRSFRYRELIDIFNSVGVKKYILNWKWAFRWQAVVYSQT